MSLSVTGRVLAMIFTTGLLGGCAAGFQEEFSCDKVGGISGCVTMNDVNNWVDQGRAFPEEGQVVQGTANLGTVEAPTFGSRRPVFAPQPPERTPERIQEVVIFPYVDAANHYHDTSVIYILLNKPQWTGFPVVAVEEE